MSDEQNKLPREKPEVSIEKAQQSGQMNESKIPDFKFTPPPPPPPPQKDNNSSGENESKS